MRTAQIAQLTHIMALKTVQDNGGYVQLLLRKKSYEDDFLTTPLDRCLSTYQLLFIGIGITITGAFAVIGMVIQQAGSAAIISLFFSGLIALIIAFSYIELACRIPKAGSGYTYTYIAIGEVVAFVVGWATWMEYLAGLSSSAAIISTMFNTMLNNSISDYMTALVNSTGWPSDSQVLSPYPDFISFGIVLVSTLLFISGAHLSSWLIGTVSITTVLVLVVVDITLFVYADASNFAPAAGGFAPFGANGVIVATATAIYIFVGFDSQTIASEELKDPIKSIPISIIASTCVVTVLLVITSLALSLFVPYYDIQQPSAAIITAFENANITWAATLAGVGGMIGMLTSVLISVYAAARIIFAMARDGLAFTFLGTVWLRTKVPVYATLVSGAIGAVMATFLDLQLQVNMTVVAALIAYTLVGVSVIALRFMEPQPFMYQTSMDNDPDLHSQEQEDLNEKTPLIDTAIGHLKVRTSVTRKLDDYGSKKPLTPFIALAFFVILATWFAILVKFAGSELVSMSWWAISLVALIASGMVACIVIMMLYQQNDHTISTFKVPLVPIVPCIGVTVNIILILGLPSAAWIACFLWLAVGLVIYFAYGMQHSLEKAENKLE